MKHFNAARLVFTALLVMPFSAARALTGEQAKKELLCAVNAAAANEERISQVPSESAMTTVLMPYGCEQTPELSAKLAHWQSVSMAFAAEKERDKGRLAGVLMSSSEQAAAAIRSQTDDLRLSAAADDIVSDIEDDLKALKSKALRAGKKASGQRLLNRKARLYQTLDNLKIPLR